MKNFIEAHVTFGNNKNYRIFELKMEKMVKYETTEDILAWLDNDKLLADARKEKERVEKEKERVEKQKERLRERSVMGFLSQAMAKSMIATVLEMTVEEINAIEAKYKGKNPFAIPLNGNSKN